MYKFITGLLVVTVLTPFISYAALTDSQMQTVLSLLSSYSVDQSTMQDVQRSLSGTVLGATTACPILTTTLQRGMKDVTTNGQVTELQKFLAAYYGLSELDTVTGYFGVVTQRTVGRFQTEQGLSPVGIVGPQTRAKIAAVCSGGSTTTTILPKPGPICPAIAYTPIECATGSLSVRYDANGCQNGWICTTTATTTASTLSVSLDASSPGFQLVPGGATNIIVGTYKVRATGEAIQLQKLSLKLTAGISSDLNKVTLWDGSTKVGEAFFIGGATTATSVFTQSVLVPQNTDKVITVKADFSLIGTGEPVSVSGHLVQIDYQNGQGLGMTSGLPIFSVGSTAVAGVRVLKSFPATVTNLSSSLTAGGLVDGRLMRFSITADTSGPIGLTQLFVNVAPTGAQVSNVNIYGYEDSGFSTPISGVTSSGALRSTDECPTGCTSNNTANIGITTSGGTPTAIQIPAGATRYFEVRGSVTGIQTGALVTSRLVGDGVFSGPASATSFVGKDAHFIWSSIWLGIALDAFAKSRKVARKQFVKNTQQLPGSARILTEMHNGILALESQIEALSSHYVACKARQDQKALRQIDFAISVNALKLNASNTAKTICLQALEVCGLAGYKNDDELSVARNIRDVLSANIMVSNERLIEVNAARLLV